MKVQESPVEVQRTSQEERCEGSGVMLIDGRCAVCYQITRPRAGGRSAIHREPAWLKERRALVGT